MYKTGTSRAAVSCPCRGTKRSLFSLFPRPPPYPTLRVQKIQISCSGYKDLMPYPVNVPIYSADSRDLLGPSSLISWHSDHWNSSVSAIRFPFSPQRRDPWNSFVTRTLGLHLFFGPCWEEDELSCGQAKQAWEVVICFF